MSDATLIYDNNTNYGKTYQDTQANLIGDVVMTFGSLFAGIGGFDLGFEQAGMVCKWQGDIDDYCNRIRQKHWPDVPQFGDIRECGAHNLEAVDVICGGFPCQPFSVAGKQRGEADDRHLWPEMLRVISELKPTWVVGENVPNFLNMGLDQAIADLEKEGYQSQPFIIPACAVNADQERKRVFIVAYCEESSTFSKLEQSRIWSTPKQPRGCFSTKVRNEKRKWGNEPKSRMVRVADGIPNRVDRLKCLGNAVVPAVAQFIGECIMRLEQNK